MARKPFDPFDERHRDKIKRRNSAEVAAENKAWNDRVENHFRRELEIYRWPDYVDSEMLLSTMDYHPEKNVDRSVLQRNFCRVMTKLGYEKFTTENNQRGRWKVAGIWTVVYFKRGATKIDKSELKQALER